MSNYTICAMSASSRGGEVWWIRTADPVRKHSQPIRALVEFPEGLTGPAVVYAQGGHA